MLLKILFIVKEKSNHGTFSLQIKTKQLFSLDAKNHKLNGSFKKIQSHITMINSLVMKK
jgi:hypothetical protein